MEKGQRNMRDRTDEQQSILDEAARSRESAGYHKEKLKCFWMNFAIVGMIVITIVVLAAVIGLGWLASNSRVNGAMAGISASGQSDFALATVGVKSQGIYDSIFSLTDKLTTETIGDTEYHISSGNSSFRIDSDKNLNNYLANADLRPGNRGNFDLYVICRTDKRDVVLQPVFSAWYETKSVDKYADAFSAEDLNKRTAAEFLKGHVLLFANMDEKGMYSYNIDLTKQINIDLSAVTASQSENKTFPWGECVFSDENTAVYRLPVYWVWPEQFGNFIYTGNSYNKNLFASDESLDYEYFLSEMENPENYKKFFYIEENVNRPSIDTITSPEKYENDYKAASENYELYSGWYNAADELIGTEISYIELGFEILQTV